MYGPVALLPHLIPLFKYGGFGVPLSGILSQNYRVPCAFASKLTLPRSTHWETMVEIGSIRIEPPLINSSCAWASELHELQALYQSPYTGAVTTRTATLTGFAENSSHTVG